MMAVDIGDGLLPMQFSKAVNSRRIDGVILFIRSILLRTPKNIICRNMY